MNVRVYAYWYNDLKLNKINKENVGTFMTTFMPCRNVLATLFSFSSAAFIDFNFIVVTSMQVCTALDIYFST